MLRTNEQFTLAAEAGLKEQRRRTTSSTRWWTSTTSTTSPTPICSTTWPGQMVRHLQALPIRGRGQSVLDRDRRLIAREIHAQMMAHFWEEATEYEVQVSRGFTELKPCNYTATAGQPAHHFRETVTELRAASSRCCSAASSAACTRCRSSTRTPSGALPSSSNATR
jgi:type III restriction enzyme